MKTTKYIIKAILVLSILIPTVASAQEGQVVDKIIAKVDDKIILKSELESAYIQFLTSPQAQSFQGDAKCVLLQSFVESKVMLIMSEIDSVEVGESRLDYEIRSRGQQIIQRFGSEEAIQQAYGKSLDQIMNELRPSIEEQIRIEEQENNILADITVTPKEVRKFYNRFPQDSLPLYSMEYEIGVIVKEPDVSDAEKERVKKVLLDIRERALNGESFEILATFNSEGPSAKDGGNLGFASRGTMDPAYEAGALSLKPGEISMPVESSFGIHLIQLVEKRGNEYQTRHIIMSPKPNEDDLAKASSILEDLRNKILTDSISFEQAAQLVSDDESTKVNGGFYADQFGSLRIPANSLEPELFFEIDKMKEGDISMPQLIEVGTDAKVARIIYYKKKLPPHRANLTDDYEKLKAATTQMKKSLKRAEYIKEKMQEVYLEIDPVFNRCGIIKNQ
ncbi:peptidylprolyl isomerase [Roseivirga sp. E12]|uniref:peptidylprolyl isomerase n=1 Tax=Roseivirga sp. E12 TaxID=2819237 RepID=UPI001ABC7271|nr:peptidylprolyl isomerase [Roseivirga sp. E12]MBO3699718.1 peptidylprolyl isomerase [Roseivirga sp. E12]